MSQILETQGIIIRSIKYSETSLIFDVFTRDHGLVSCIAGGVRNQKSKQKANVLQVLNIIDFSYYAKENNNLHRIQKFELAYVYQKINLEVIPSSVGVFLIECTRNSIKERESNQELFQFIKSQYLHLDGLDHQSLTHFYISYLLHLSKHLGFYPLNDYSELKPYFNGLQGHFVSEIDDMRYVFDLSSSNLLAAFLREDDGISLKKDQAKSLLDAILIYYKLHLDSFKEIKSLEVLRSL